MPRKNVIAILERTPETAAVISRLFFADLDTGEKFLELYTVEKPWQNNKPQVSCIPGGVYPVSQWNSPKFGQCYKVHNVPGREYILIHPANYSEQLEGCIAPGLTRADINADGVTDVTNSRRAMALMKSLLPESFNLIITTPNGQPMGA